MVCYGFSGVINWASSGVFTIYMEKPEIPVKKSNGSRHSVCESSENMGCDFRQ